jgi:hypothetical protein
VEYVWQQIARLAEETFEAKKQADKERLRAEALIAAETARAEAEAQRAEAEAQRAEALIAAETARAEAEAQRAEAEAQRAEALAEENKRLRALLDKR